MFVGIVVPSIERSLMRGSVGEFTAAERVIRTSGSEQITFAIAPCVGPTSSVDAVVSSACDSAVTIREMFAAEPNIVLFSTFRAFWQFPVCRVEAGQVFEECANRRIPMALIDPCGDSFGLDPPPGVKALLPVPFSYSAEPGTAQLMYSALEAPTNHERAGRVLWSNGDWMTRFASFRAAERIGLGLLRNIDSEVHVLRPLLV